VSQSAAYVRWPGALAIAVMIAATALLLLPRGDNGAPRIRVLGAGYLRPTPGRLAGEARYRPWKHRSSIEPSDAELLHMLANVAAQSHQPASVLDAAVVDLVRGSIAKAIAGFELASSRPAEQEEALTDLSAAYLARFDAGGDCIDLLRAVQAADRGLHLFPRNEPLRFNRAVALSRLGARTLATREANAINDADERWRAEAAAHVQALNRRTIEEEWRLERPRLDAPAVTAGEVEAVVARLPMNARAFCESELLPLWAVAAERGDSRRADRELRLASMIADALRRTRGEELANDVVASIRRVMTSGTPADRARLFAGLRSFGEGAALYEEQKLSSAERPLREAASALDAIGNPLAQWARFYLAIHEYYGNAASGLATLTALLHAIPADRYPALAGRIEWIAGTAEQVQGHVQSSVGRYERAASYLRRAGGDPAAAFVTVLLAQTYTALGEHRVAWDARLRAFHAVPYAEELRRDIAMWSEAKEALVRQNAVTLARPLVEEEVVAAEKWGRALGIATAYLDRAAYRLEVGDEVSALADLQRAKDAIAHIEAGGLREQMTNIARITEGMVVRYEAPERAATLLRAGLQAQASTGTIFDSITYTTELANAEIRSGHTADGASSLERVIRLMEGVRATVEDPVTRMQAFRQAQPAFNRLIDLRLLAHEDAAAFALAERARSRVVLDMRGGRQGERFASLQDVARAMPADTVLVSFVVLDDRVAAWVIGGGVAHMVTLSRSPGVLEREIVDLRLEMARGASADSIRAASAALYRDLIAPLELYTDAPPKALVIVPDRVLARVPFAVLFDSKKKQYLIEEREVSIAPSATVLLAAGTRHRSQPQTALAAGISRSGVFHGVALPALPYAERDAEEVSRWYPKTTLLVRGTARPENFLNASLHKDVIQFSGHAVVDTESPRRSVLLFVDAADTAFEPLSLGRLLAAGMRDVRLVVLAACRTEDSVADDREGQMGLAGAFIASGADEMLASSFDVDDTAVTPLLRCFHGSYSRSGRAPAAFRAAVLELLRNGSESSKSPAIWGCFSIIRGTMGQGGMQ